MKYLKRFESLEGTDIFEELKEIFRELSEDIFEVYISDSTQKWSRLERNKGVNRIDISIYKNSSGKVNASAENIYLSEIKECCKRAVEYLDTEGYYLEFVIPYGTSKEDINKDFNNWAPSDVVMAMNLYFKER